MPTKLRPLRVFLNGPRAKPRLALGVALAVLAATAAWSFTRPKIYEATASYRIEHRANVIYSLYNEDGSMSLKCGPGDSHSELNTYKKIFESTLLAKRVANRVSTERAFDRPASENPQDLSALVDSLLTHRRVLADEGSKRISITFRHSAPEQVARIATFFAEEVQAWSIQTEADEIRHFGADLQEHIELTRKRIQELEMAAAIADSADTDEPTDHVIQAANKRVLTAHRRHLDQLQERHDAIPAMLAQVKERNSVIPAEVPAADAYVSPNHPLNLALGLLAGLILGTLVSALAAHRAAREPQPCASEA